MKTKRNKYAYIGETSRRSWLKSIIWRIVGILILGGLGWLVTHNWEQTTVITTVFHTIRFILYYVHERLWDDIEWGRIKATEQVSSGEGI